MVSLYFSLLTNKVTSRILSFWLILMRNNRIHLLRQRHDFLYRKYLLNGFPNRLQHLSHSLSENIHSLWHFFRSNLLQGWYACSFFVIYFSFKITSSASRTVLFRSWNETVCESLITSSPYEKENFRWYLWSSSMLSQWKQHWPEYWFLFEELALRKTLFNPGPERNKENQ